MSGTGKKIAGASIGIDGCRAGWFYVRLGPSAWSFGVLTNISELAAIQGPADTVLIDIPIGLITCATNERRCDKAARKWLGPGKGSSVFPVPCRAAVAAQTYSEASATNFMNTGRNLSRQTWGILPKIREVDEFLRGVETPSLPREMHPEVCFRALSLQQGPDASKKTKEGFRARLAILANHFPGTNELVSQALDKYLRKEVARDDVLDALVGAVTGRYRLCSLPVPAEFDAMGLPMEIVYADLKSSG